MSSPRMPMPMPVPVGGWNVNANAKISGNGRDGSGTSSNNSNQFRRHGTPSSSFSSSSNDKHPRQVPSTQNQRQNRWSSASSGSAGSGSGQSRSVPMTLQVQTQTPDQLSNLKKQWNVERDVPSGAVKNNPFVPKQQVQVQAPPPAQLMHQKRQWDTSGIIQRGSVAARKMSMEVERDDSNGMAPSPSRMSPQMQNLHHRFGHGLASPAAHTPSHASANKPNTRRSFPLDDISRIHQPSSPVLVQTSAKWTGTTSTTGNGTGTGTSSTRSMKIVADQGVTATSFSASRGGLAGLNEKPFDPIATQATRLLPGQVSAGNWTSSAPKWEPSKEIPKGMVKGRLDRLVSPTAMTAGPRRQDAQGQNEHNDPERRFHYEDSDDDPWIIPAEKSGPTKVFAENWGEALAPVKSEESDDWDSPATEWLKSSESQTTVSADLGNSSKLTHRKRFNLGVVEEKKINKTVDEEGTDTAQAQGKDDPFETTHQRDQDILRAARQKTKTQQKSRKPFVDVLDVFDTDAQADQHGFIAQPFQQDGDAFNHAFPSSPFGGNSNFDDFSADDRSSLQDIKNITHPSASFQKNSNTISYDDDFVDAIQSEQAHYQTAVLDQTLKNVPDTIPSQTKEEWLEVMEDSPPKKKGFFNKLFGGARKNRKSTGSESKNKLPRNDDVHEPLQEFKTIDSRESTHQINKLSTPMEMKPTFEADVTYEANVSPKLASGKSEDDTTVSEMTLPTVFKDHTKPFAEKIKTVMPVMETPEEQDDSTEDVPVLETYEEPEEVFDVFPDDPGFVAKLSHSETDATADDAGNTGKMLLPYADINSNQKFDLRQPPPPPPVHRLEQGIVAADAVQEVRPPLESARFTRRVKEFRTNTTRHQIAIAKATTKKEENQSEKRVPGFVSRHARNRKGQTKRSDTIVDFAGESNSLLVPSGNVTKLDKKFHKASRAFQQGKLPQGLSSHGSAPGSIDQQRVKPIGVISGRSAMIEGSGSGRSQRSVESSVGSDIRVLRTILRRPRKGKEPVQVYNRPKPAFAAYDESSITDPMQRAGLRLLSAAIIPIQTEVRRFLAMRRALTRMWALLAIQAAARSWMARQEFIKKMDAIVKVQAIFRGNQERGDLIYKHICAIEIQRYVRGYLSTVRVYEDIYKVTMVQSYVRMKLAMEEATNRMALLIQLQAVSRGFLVRRRLEYQEACAVAIQANWRCFFARLTYQFDLLDVIIVQSVWRRKKAVKKVQRARDVAHNAAATLIQSKWRSYDCTMNYLHFLADVLIVQSTVRRFLVLTRVRKIRNEAATMIQSVWRGFVCYADYMFSIADIVVIQKVARRWLAKQKTKLLRNLKHHKSAVILQRFWRRHFYARRIQRVWRSMVLERRREKAAVLLQLCWRQYFYIRRIQRAWRSMVIKRERVHAAVVLQTRWRQFFYARRIQRAWRSKLFKRERENAAFILQKCWRKSFYARRIQRAWRSKLLKKERKNAAVVLQKYWRKFIYAKRIQRAWRSKVFRREREKAAVAIQKSWRCFVDETEFVVMKYEYYAARTIQTYWRRFWCFSNFIISLDCSIQIQSAYRGYRERMVMQTLKMSAEKIQTGVRRLLALKKFESMVRSEKIAIAAHQQSTLETFSALLIQTNFRAMQARVAVNAYFAARRIQSVVRGHQARTAVRLFVCARRIQAIWRAKRIHTAYRFYRAALMIQTRYRGMRARRDMLVVRGEYLAATLIQSAWRGFVCYTDYIFTISDIISAQKTARRFLAQKKYGWQVRDNIRQHKKENCASLLMQKVGRGFIARQRYWYTLGCTMQIQSWIRGRIVMRRLRREAWARLKLQCFARRCLGRQEYLQRKFILMLLRTADQERTNRVAVTVIQERCKGYLNDRKREESARVIQRFFLMVKREVDQMVKARKRRKIWRKKMKNSNNNVEDALLEDAWASAVGHTTLSGKPILISTPSSQDFGPNENLRANVGRSRGSGYFGNESRLKVSGDPARSMKPKLPPRLSETPSSVVRLHHDDDKSEYSGLTISTATYTRLPLSRSKRLSPREMDEDLELEEAFIDAEIFSAKGRKLAQNSSMPHTGIALRGSTKLNVIPPRG